jgi:hypothetical protein
MMTTTPDEKPHALSAAQVDQFIRDGFVWIDRAFSPELAEEARAILWCDIPCDPDDPATWTRPVVRLGWYPQRPFWQAANTAILHAAIDQLVGKGRWIPRQDLGTFPVRFPHPKDPGDAGWHVDVSFPGPDSDARERQDFSSWRVNISSRGRALVMLFLFSDIGPRDAPTRLRVGSHLDMARFLAPAGEAGLASPQVGGVGADLPEAAATGEAGTVYLCHPFIIHAAQKHRGTEPRFLAQPSLALAKPYRLKRAASAYSPVEIAIRQALGMG